MVFIAAWNERINSLFSSKLSKPILFHLFERLLINAYHVCRPIQHVFFQFHPFHCLCSAVRVTWLLYLSSPPPPFPPHVQRERLEVKNTSAQTTLPLFLPDTHWSLTDYVAHQKPCSIKAPSKLWEGSSCCTRCCCIISFPKKRGENADRLALHKCGFSKENVFLKLSQSISMIPKPPNQL